MNYDWETPPGGDFARYVERLSAQTGQFRGASQDIDDVGLDIGMQTMGTATPVPATTPVLGAEPPQGAPVPGPAYHLAKAMAIAWAAVLVMLLVLNASFSLVFAVLVTGLWLGWRLRRWALPSGAASWRQWLEVEARRQKLRQEQARQGRIK